MLSVKILQKKGMAASIIRSDRPTSEGRLFIRNDNTINMVKVYSVKCETDFVANSADFANLINTTNLEADVDKLKISLRENICIGKNKGIFYQEGDVVATYVHSDHKTGAVVILRNVKNYSEEVEQFAKDCCLHLVAFTPKYFSAKTVPEKEVNEMKEIFKAQMDADPKMANKPENVKENILTNKTLKHFQEQSFIDQKFVKDDKVTVNQKLNSGDLKDSVFYVAEWFEI